MSRDIPPELQPLPCKIAAKKAKARRERDKKRRKSELVLGIRAMKSILESCDRLRHRIATFLRDHRNNCRCGLCRKLAQAEAEMGFSWTEPTILGNLATIVGVLDSSTVPVYSHMPQCSRADMRNR